MSRDLADENYYVSHGGKIPVKWTAPEVWTLLSGSKGSYLGGNYYYKFTCTYTIITS